MRVLVLGSTGQVGTELLRSPMAGRFDVSAPAGLDFTAANSLEQALTNSAPDLVVNAAAYTLVDRAEEERDQAFAVNAGIPRLVARWCAEHSAKMLHISTDYVFDGKKLGDYTEDDPTGPLSAYGASKLEGELGVRANLREHVILRTSWVFSAWRQNFVKTMLRLGQQRPELGIVADQRGRPTAARDIAEALWALASQLDEHGQLPWGAYHFAGSEPTTWYGFAGAIFERARQLGLATANVKPITNAEYPTPATRPSNSVLDTSRFEKTFSLSPRPWRAGLDEVLRALQECGWKVT